MTTDLAVIIVSWKVREHLDRCLASLRAALDADGITASIVVVDNASSDGTVELVRQVHPWATVEVSPKNLGFVGGCNLGLQKLQGSADAYWLLNPDTLIPAGTPRRMLEFLGSEPRAGLIGPKLLNTDGSIQESAFRFPGLLQVLFSLDLMPRRLYFSALNGRYADYLYLQDSPFRIDHPLGAAMMASKQAVEHVGPLDTGYFMYCEEIDWAWRMRKAGYTNWLLPDVTVTHVGGASSRQMPPETTRFLWESRARLYRKHRRGMTYGLARIVVHRAFRARREATSDASWLVAYDGITRAWA